MRIQLELPEDKVGELEALMAKAGIATKKELFNVALTLFEWAVHESSSGRIIASMDEEQQRYKELVMPALSAAVVRQSSNEHRSSSRSKPEDPETLRIQIERTAEVARSIAEKLAEEGRQLAEAARQGTESARGP